MSIVLKLSTKAFHGHWPLVEIKQTKKPQYIKLIKLESLKLILWISDDQWSHRAFTLKYTDRVVTRSTGDDLGLFSGTLKV